MVFRPETENPSRCFAQEWCESRNIIHEQSSAHHHESNGHAEVTVREMKHLLEKTNSWEDFRHALLEWRNTPRQHDKLSPAQWFLGRRQKTQAAALPEAYQRISDHDFKEAEIIRGEERRKTKERTPSSPKSSLDIGEKVLIQHWRTRRWDLSGVIVEKRNRRSYLVEAENGKRYLRNRKFLRPDNLPEQTGTFVAEQSPTKPEPEIKPILRRSERTCAKKKTVYFKK